MLHDAYGSIVKHSAAATGCYQWQVPLFCCQCYYSCKLFLQIHLHLDRLTGNVPSLSHSQLSAEMPGTSSVEAPLLAALAELGLRSEQLSRIKGKLVVELQLSRQQHQTGCCTVEVSLQLHALVV